MLETREGGCHCGQIRFRAQVDLDLLSQCSCSVCTKKGILHLPVTQADFVLLRRCIDGLHLRNRRGATSVLCELRNASVLRAALATGQGHGECTVPRWHRRSGAKADAIF
jgi:hypothetical protein